MGETRALLTTVVIPVADEAEGHSLIEAVRSLREQETQLRTVVVNNALRNPLPVLPGVSIVRARERLTEGAARNLGLERVSTPFVIFWPPDAVMPPRTVPLLEEALRADERLVAFAIETPRDQVDRSGPPRNGWVARLRNVANSIQFQVAYKAFRLKPSTRKEFR